MADLLEARESKMTKGRLPTGDGENLKQEKANLEKYLPSVHDLAMFYKAHPKTRDK